MSQTVNPYDDQQKNLERAKAAHQSWNNCVMITSNNDTIKGWVQKSADYRLTGGLFVRNKVLFASADGTEQKIRANQFYELYIPAEDSGYRKYITIAGDDDLEINRIYRVAVDGKCRLLSQNIHGSTPPLGLQDDDIEKFYFYYKGKLMPANFKAAAYNNPVFISECRKFFSDCPGLITQIENRTIPSGNLSAIVKEFNNCLANRH